MEFLEAFICLVLMKIDSPQKKRNCLGNNQKIRRSYKTVLEVIEMFIVKLVYTVIDLRPNLKFSGTISQT